MWASIGLFMAVAAQHDPDRTVPANDPDPEGIIVTGERVARTLRDTAASVDVTDAERIDAMSGADRIEQILEQVPNVVVGNGGDGPAIRGQDTNGVLRDLPAFLGGNRPRTTLQVDGRAVSFSEMVFGSAPLWDIERVEVFRTPQTTTQGLNSVAGAIFIHSKDPSFEWETSARLLAGNFGTRQASAVLSGPIVDDQLAFRLAGDLRRASPSVKIADTIGGASPNNDDYGLLRFKLLGQPGFWPGTRVELTYAHSASLMPGSEHIRAPFRERRNSFGVATFDTDIDSLTLSVEHPLATALRASTTLSHGDAKVRRYAFPGLGDTQTHIRDFSAETVLDWNPEGPMRAVLGVSHWRSSLDQTIDLSLFIGLGAFDDEQRSTGLFGEITLELAPRMTVTAGLRRQSDLQQRSGVIGTPGRPVPLDYDRRFSAWLPKLSVAYDVTDGIRAGLLIQRAYNPGGITLQIDTGAQEPFGAESLWNHELFARARLAGGTVRLAGNLFYTAMRNSQRYQFYTVSLPGGPPVTLAEIFNVPRARSYGAEVTADWQASRRLTARLGIGLLDTKITGTDDASQAFHGREFARAPGLTASGGIDWRPVDALRLSAQVRHHGGYFSDDRETEALHVRSATLFDARGAWTTGQITIFGYVRNLFDTFRLRALFNPVLATAHDPREFGLGIETRF